MWVTSELNKKNYKFKILGLMLLATGKYFFNISLIFENRRWGLDISIWKQVIEESVGRAF